MPQTYLALVLACLSFSSVGLSADHAQTPAGGAGGQSTGTPQAGQEVTAVGCLMRIDTSGRRPGTSGSTAAGKSVKSESGFTLKNAAIRKGEGFDTPRPTERELGIAVGDVKVDAHAGHQVEIKGYFVGNDGNEGNEGNDEEAKGGGAAGKRSPQSELRSVNAGGNDIKVTAIRSLADDCPVR